MMSSVAVVCRSGVGERIVGMESMERVLQARLQLPQASQLTRSPAAAISQASSRNNDKFGAGCCSSTAILAPSQFLSGDGRNSAFRSRGSELCSPSSSYSPRGGGGGGVLVVCMAKERRVKMVSQQIRREISEMLLYDKVVQAAVLPETALGADMYLTAVATVSEVEMSKDLSVAKVYISIYGDERGQEKAIEALKGKAGYVRKGLAKRMNLKFTPEVRFIKDEALERGSKVIGILDKLKKERQLKEGNGPINGEEEEEEGEKDVDAADKQEDHGDDGEEIEEEVEDNKAGKSLSGSRDDGDGPDWDDTENITFIR